MDLKSLIVHVLVAIFGICSWIGVNSFWMELPLLVPLLPEGWNLPSYLAVIVQLGNIGPIVFAIGKRCSGRLAQNPEPVIIGLMATGILGMVLMAQFWSETFVVLGSPHSLALFFLTFVISVTNCTSNVTSLPYMSRFKSDYLVAYFIGMGFSGFLPGLLALGQGAANIGCVPMNSSNNSALFKPELLPPNFSIRTYFLLISLVILASLLCFFGLKFKSLTKSPAINPQLELCKVQEVKEKQEEPEPAKFPKFSLVCLLIMTTWASLLQDSVLPSLQSYTALPYGVETHYWAVLMMGVSNPLGSLAVFFFQPNRLPIFACLLAVATTGSAYLIVLAALSPQVPLISSVAGSILMVGCWGVANSLFSFIRTRVAEVLRIGGGEPFLFYFGIAVQVGAFSGAAIIFPLMNIYRVFKSAPYC